MTHKLVSAALCCLAIAAGGAVYAQCGPRGCSTNAQAVEIQWQPGYHWVPVPGDADHVALYYRTLQVGAYCYSTGFYTAKVGGRWGDTCKSPIPVPLGGSAGDGSGHAFGLLSKHLTGRERIWNGGGTYTRGQLENMLGAELRDDSRASHVTVITNKPDVAKKALADWEAAKQKDPTAARVRFQAYDYTQPVNKAVLAPNQLEKDTAFARTGVVVLAQAAGDDKTGKSRATSIYDYTGPESLVDAVRMIDPNYDPNKSPWPKVPGIGAVPTEAYIAGGLAGIIGLAYLRRRK